MAMTSPADDELVAPLEHAVGTYARTPATVGATAAPSTSDIAERARHGLPHWFIVLKDSVMLSMLIVAEMVINGIFMTTGVVGDLMRPDTWGIFGTIMVVVMLAAGGILGGMTVFCSYSMALAIMEKNRKFAVINGIGLLLFGIIEIWAGLYERGPHVGSNPIDSVFLGAIHSANSPLLPTVVLLSIAVPAAAVFVGFADQSDQQAHMRQRLANQKIKQQMALEKQQAKAQQDLVKAQSKAARRGVALRGWASAARGAIEEANGKASSTPSPMQGPFNPDDDPGNGGPPRGGISTRKPGSDNISSFSPKSGTSSRNTSQFENAKGRNPDYMMWSDVVSYVQRRFGFQINKTIATEQIIKKCEFWREKTIPGRPTVAKKAQVIQRISVWARENGYQPIAVANG